MTHKLVAIKNNRDYKGRITEIAFRPIDKALTLGLRFRAKEGHQNKLNCVYFSIYFTTAKTKGFSLTVLISVTFRDPEFDKAKSFVF